MLTTLRRLFAAALVVATPAAAGAAPIPSTPAKAKGENAVAAARKALDEVGDMNYQSRSLTDVVNDIKEKTKVPVVLDNMVFQFGLDPSQPVVTVNLKQVKLKDGLKAALAPFNLRYGLTAEGVYISTEEGVITRQLRQRVSVDCDGTSFSAAAKQLALDTGANVVVDPRLGDKANKSVTLRLEDVPLETAVRLLAEVADLRATRMSNVLFVTTADKVKERGLPDDGPAPPGMPNPFFPAGPGGPNILLPGGGIGGFGGINPPPVVDPVPADPPAPPPDKPVQAPPPPATTAPGSAPPGPPAVPPPAPPVEKKP
jgi:hypothetical protein